MKTENFSLSNKVALITGAGRGIGKSIALGFAAAGANVVAISRTISEIEQTCEAVKACNVKGLPLVCDVGNAIEVRETVKRALVEFGQIDVLVNNAGISPFVVPIENIREDGWNRVINVNLNSVFLFTQEVGRQMIVRQKGKVINMTSIGGVVGLQGQAAYCVSKAGIIMLTKMFALEWGKYQINVNALGPGIVETQLTEKFRQDRDIVQDRLKRIPLNRFAAPDEMVGAALFLASDLSNYMTGQTIFIDGGRLTGV
ncbi:MAG: SDR family oxidoreductase [Deltaproteobacteria bacterium]|nr:SDR family oxidoreductase [Deltaproteobacteria bacterium]